MRELNTIRLRLRPLVAGDRDALYSISAEAEVIQHLIMRPQSIEEFRQPFDQMLELSSTLGMWAIVHKDDDRLIGRCGYFPCSEVATGTPELVYVLSRAYWGVGLATEAARRCLEYSFCEHAWPEVVAMVRIGNAASVRVLRKLGMDRLRPIDVRGIAADLYRLRRTVYLSREASERGAMPTRP